MIKEKLRMFNKSKQSRHIKTIIAVTLSAFLQAVTLHVFITPAHILSGGVLGTSILINRIAGLSNIDIPIALIQLVINVIVAALCIRGISVRFTLYSILQVALSSLFMRIFTFAPLLDNTILNVIFGGALNGLYISIALRGNASTGGTDFIALYISNKSGRTIWEQVFVFNILLLVIFGYLFGWEYAAYSIIFQYISTKVISTFHHRYKLVTLQITTREASKVMHAYTKNVRHGISCVEAIGGYSHVKMYLLHTVVSAYEVQDAVEVLQEADPNVIINQLETSNFYGSFYREPE